MSLEHRQRLGGDRSGRVVAPDASPDVSGRRVAVAAGVLLLVATITVLVADAVEPDFAAMATTRGSVGVAALLRILAAGASVGIAVALYPLLRLVGPAMALGSVVFRTIEAVMYLAGVVGLLTLAALSGSAPTDEATSSSTVRSLVEVLTSVRREAGLVAVFAFAVGAFMYYALMYQARLVPVWLSIWGLLAVGLLVVAALLAAFTGQGVSEYKVLAAPIFVQELVLGVWLLVKGFATPVHPVEHLPLSRDTDH